MTCRKFASLAAGVLCLFSLALLAQAQDVGWDVSQIAPWPSAVSPQAVVVEGTTDIRWTPEPFVYKAGESVRYIDFDNGRDAASGKTPQEAWKHHPWDPAAKDLAAAERGRHTYVFKGGVAYRGNLVARDSGTASAPIRLTCDPAWGTGRAIIAGSMAVTQGWQKVAAPEGATAGFPSASHERLWRVDLPGEFVPRALWVLGKEGARTRVPIARWPNWKAEHPYNHFTQWHRVEKIEKGFPATRIFALGALKESDAKAYAGATIWCEHANTSGEFSIMGPFPAAADSYDPQTGSLAVKLDHPRRHPQPKSPFFLENHPRFLDAAGEWYFDSPGRRLYVRLPEDADPRDTVVEVARHEVVLDIVDQQHIEVAGLEFVGGNAGDLSRAPRAGDWDRPDNHTQMAAIRLTGNCKHIVMRNLSITHTAGCGIANWVRAETDVLEDIAITDSWFENIDNDGVILCITAGPIRQPVGDMTDIRILRNRFEEIGLRCSTNQGGRGVHLSGLKVGEVAGNVMHRLGAQGINIWGGRGEDNPLVRIQVYRNRVSEGLLHKTDFGNIEFWSYGPAYVYNNITIDPVGYVASRGIYHKNEAFYFDHGYKGYLFNNIGWSKDFSEAYKGTLGNTFFKEVRNRWNMAFHNTAYNFRAFQNMEGVYGDQQCYLGNLAINVRGGFLAHWGLDKAAGIAYSRNVFAGNYENIYARWKGPSYRTLQDMQDHVAMLKNHLATDVGWVTDDMPVVDPQARDFRLTDTSAAIDRGVKVFLPWALYAEVGEWHFRCEPGNPNTVLAHDLYVQPAYKGASFQIGGDIPGNELVGEGFAVDDYIQGVLEDWNRGALRLDGRKVLTLPQKRLAQTRKGDTQPATSPAASRKTVEMQANNFLIEAVLLVDAGPAGGSIARKMDPQAGYGLGLDEQGCAVLDLRTGGKTVRQTGRKKLNDGRWHHILAEVDRVHGAIRLYVDGHDVSGQQTGEMPAALSSLENTGDFIVGERFRGAIDFLRVSRGTLEDARTTIAELMSWQFNGPHLHDFTGRAATGGVRDTGALEHPTISGRRPIRYTPPASAPADKPAQDKAADEFLTGPDRTVKAVEWGSISLPKQAAIGEKIKVQVVFGTESVESRQQLRVHLHGFVGSKRIGAIAQSGPLWITPGSTAPYTVEMQIRPREGLTRVAVVIFTSPDGKWENKKLATEGAVAIVGGAATTQPVVPVARPVEPVGKPGAGMAASAPQAVEAGDRTVKELPWATVSAPRQGKPGEKITLWVSLKADALAAQPRLRVDTHWYEGRKRKPGGPRSAPKVIGADATQPVEVQMVIPDKPGITAAQFIVYLSPDGDYANKTHSSEIGVKVVAP